MSQVSDPSHNNIGNLRLILALTVLFSHSFPLTTGTYESEPLYRLTSKQLALGELAVDWFFVLSGFLIAQSWNRSRSVGSFLEKRVCRIYPGYIVAVAVSVWVVVPLASPEGLAVYSWKMVGDNIWRALLLRRFVAPGAFLANPHPGEVNGSLWTIPFEFQCYLGVVLLGLTTLLRRERVILILLLATIVISYAFEFFNITTNGRALGVIFGSPRSWARLLPLYLSGVVAFLFRDRIRFDRRLAFISVIGLAVGAVTPYGLTIALPIFGTCLLFYLSFTTDWHWRDATRYGDFSYGIYLFSYPIQQLIVMKAGRSLTPLQLFGLSFLPTVLAGSLSWYLVERHFLRQAHKKVSLEPRRFGFLMYRRRGQP